VLTVGSLFAGIGGFDLGLERAGMRSVWQCEIDPYCQRVLAKHWPDVLRVPDIRDVGAGTVPYVDVICGGFPCQDLSYAGKGAGLDGERSGLWSEYARVIRELRPRYVLVENVSALLARGLGRVLGDLAEVGMACEWGCIRAADVGAPHLRDRVWLVAYRTRDGATGTAQAGADGQRTRACGDTSCMADANEVRREWRPRIFGPGWWGELEDCGWWLPQSGVRGVVDGISPGLDGGRLDGNTDQGGSGEAMPTLLGASDPQAVHDGPAGGSRTVSEADLLRHGMPAGGAGDGLDQQADDVFAITQGAQGGVRAMRNDGTTARPSQGRGHHEQRAGELGDAVRGVPQPPPLCGRVPNRKHRLRSLGNALVPQIAEWLGHRIIEWEREQMRAA
jgi:DNA (cytosine-5)-methyltransferase 1